MLSQFFYGGRGWVGLLPSLEVEELDAVCEYEEEQEVPPDVRHCHSRQELVLKPQFVLQERLQLHRPGSRNYEILVLVSHLRRH